jgi:crossover junction endodeoxyribonuclease RusA
VPRGTSTLGRAYLRQAKFGGARQGFHVIELELPYPPSLNHYYRTWQGRTLISRAGRAFREQVCAILAAWGVRRMCGRLAVTITVYPPDNRRRDLDNALKALLDALQHGGAYRDDSQIVRLEMEKREAVGSGKVHVHIVPFTGRRADRGNVPLPDTARRGGPIHSLAKQGLSSDGTSALPARSD